MIGIRGFSVKLNNLVRCEKSEFNKKSKLYPRYHWNCYWIRSFFYSQYSDPLMDNPSLSIGDVFTNGD